MPMECPVCGAEARIIEGRTISLLDGAVFGVDNLPHEKLGQGRFGAITVESDRLEFAENCPGFVVYWSDDDEAIVKRHLTEEERVR